MGTLILILKAIPALKDAVDRFIAFYIKQEYLQMKEANRKGIREAIDNDDQRKLEEAINSTKAGLPSGVPGSTFHDSLPNTGEDRRSSVDQ